MATLICTTCERLARLSIRTAAAVNSPSWSVSLSSKIYQKNDLFVPTIVQGPFQFFIQDKYKVIKQENPSATIKDVNVMVGEAWRSLPESEKAEYTEQFKSKKAEYDKQMTDIKDKIMRDPAYRQVLDGTEPRTKLRLLKKVLPFFKKEMREFDMGRGGFSGRQFRLRKVRVSAFDLFKSVHHGEVMQDLKNQEKLLSSSAGSQTDDPATSSPSLTKKEEYVKLFKESQSEIGKKWNSLDEEARDVYKAKACDLNDEIAANKQKYKDVLKYYNDISEQIDRMASTGDIATTAAKKKSGPTKR